MYFFKVLLVSLTTAGFVCAAREVNVGKKVSEKQELPSDKLKSELEQKSAQESESISLSLLADALPPAVTEDKEDNTQSKEGSVKPVSSSSKNKRKTASVLNNSEDGSSKLKKSPAKLSSSSDKLSTALAFENSEDDTVRSKKSPYRQARFEQFPQNPQQLQYIPAPAQTTTVCIVVRSQGHNHPVTLCGPQTNGSESDKTSLPEVQHIPAARQSQQQMSAMPIQTSSHGIHQGMQQLPLSNMQQQPKFHNQPIKITENVKPLPKSDLVQQQIPYQNIYRMPIDSSQQKPGNMQYQITPASSSSVPQTSSIIQTPSNQHKQFLVSPYTLNQNPNTYSSNGGNVITSNVPLSLNCHLQPATHTNGPVSIGQYLPSGRPGQSLEVHTQELYHKPGEARSNFGLREIPPPLFLVPNSQRSAGPMYVLPDGSPIEGANIPLGGLHLKNHQLERASQDSVHSVQPPLNQQEEVNTDSSFTMSHPEIQWQQPMLQNSLDTPLTWTGQEPIPQVQGQSLDNSFSKSAPEYITQEYLRQWDDAYHRQFGRSSEGPMEAPSVSYIPFYFHLGDDQFRSEDSSISKASNSEIPLTEAELKKKAEMQEQELKEARKRLEEMKALYQASEEKLVKVSAESKKKPEEISLASPKTDDLDKPKPLDTTKKDTVKTQDKRQTKRYHN